MDNCEIKPKLINAFSIIIGLSFIVLFIVLKFYSLPKANEIYNNYSSEQQVFLPMITTPIISFTIFIFLVFILGLISKLGKKIKIENNLVHLTKRSLVGFGKWKIIETIDLNQVDTVRDTQKFSYLPTGTGSLIPFSQYSVIIQMKDGRNNEVSLFGWDMKVIKELFNFINEKFPNVKFNTKILKNSEEELTGIRDFTETNKTFK